MLIDLTIAITPEMRQDANGNEKKTLSGHLGTHFDVMDKVFPLEYAEREGLVFDVSHSTHEEVQMDDIDLTLIREGMFVAFCSKFVETEEYGTSRYFHEHPQLTHHLINALISRKVAIIGIDFAGVRRGKEHTPTDQLCADHNIFIVENLCNLSSLLKGRQYARFKAHTYPIHFLGMTGLPCRVVAETRV